MNVLIDTHILLWLAYQPEKLPKQAVACIDDPANTLWFSAASTWEIAIKASLGRKDFSFEPGPLRAGLLANGYRELAIEGGHVLALRQLPPLHADPFDRMLVAQASKEGMALLTADKLVAAYGAPVLPV